jgi:hypothetical protein
LTAPTPLNNTDKFLQINKNLNNAYQNHIVVRSSSQGSRRPFRVKHLGKRKFQILRPVSLPMDYNDNVNRITTINNENSDSDSRSSSDTDTTSRDGIDVTTLITSDTNKHNMSSQPSIQDYHLVTKLPTTENKCILQEQQCASRDSDCLLD